MTLYIQQLQQNIVANSIEQSKGRIENASKEKGSQESLEEEKVTTDRQSKNGGRDKRPPKFFVRHAS
jgi:hypothetical protein